MTKAELVLILSQYDDNMEVIVTNETSQTLHSSFEIVSFGDQIEIQIS